MKINIAPFIISALLILAPHANAQDATPAEGGTPQETSPATTLADVSIYEAQILGQENNTLSVTFQLANNSDFAELDIHYGIELISQVDGTRVAADSYIVPETLVLAGHTSKNIILNYPIPAYLNGQYEVWVLSKTSGGLSLGVANAGFVTIHSTNSYYAEIIPDTCSLLRGDGSGDYFPLQGAVGADDTLLFNCSITNHSEIPLQVAPIFETHERSIYGEIADVEFLEADTVTLQPYEETRLSFTIPKAATPQAYAVRMSLGDPDTKERNSNTVTGYYAIQGMNAAVQNLTLDKLSYEAGETLVAIALLNSAVDASLGQQDITLNLSVVNSQGVPCIEPVTKTIKSNATQERIEVPVIAGCDVPQATLTLTTVDGIVLDTHTVNKPEQAEEVAQAAHKIPSGLAVLYTLVLMLIASTAIAVLIRTYKRRKGSPIDMHLPPPPTILKSLLFTLLVAGSFLGGAGEAQAGVSFQVNTLGWVVGFNVNADKATYAPGQAIVLSAEGDSIGDANNDGVLYINGSVTGSPSGEKRLLSATMHDYESDFGSGIFTAPNTPGDYAVNITGCARRQSGSKPWDCATGSFTITVVPPPPTSPANLGGGPLACGTGIIQVSWSSVPGAVSYELSRDGNVIDVGASLSNQHSGLAADSTHSYSVRAVNADGAASPWSSAVSLVAPADCPPGAPTGLNGGPGACGTGVIQTAWNGVAGAVSYEMNIDNTGWFSVGALTMNTHTGLAAGTQHSYEVRAVNASGARSLSSGTIYRNAPLACPVNVGVCGSANGTQTNTQPTTNLCSYGTASAVTGTGPWTWSCVGAGGSASCSAPINSSFINGACGIADGREMLSPPTAPTDLCFLGTPSAVTGTGPWNWTCIGSSGSTDSCTARLANAIDWDRVPYLDVTPIRQGVYWPVATATTRARLYDGDGDNVWVEWRRSSACCQSSYTSAGDTTFYSPGSRWHKAPGGDFSKDYDQSFGRLPGVGYFRYEAKIWDNDATWDYGLTATFQADVWGRCNGTLPANAYLVSGTEDRNIYNPLAAYTYSNIDNASIKCEFRCIAGYTWNAGSNTCDAPAPADLISTGVQGPNSAIDGTPITLAAHSRNQGLTGTGSGYTDKFQYQWNSQLSTGWKDFPGSTTTLPQLAAMTTGALDIYTFIVSSGPSFTYDDDLYVRHCVDTSFQVPEAFESNCSGSRVIRVDPSSANTAPTANAGPDIPITLPQNQVVQGGASASDPGGSVASILWSQTAGPSTATILDGNTIRPTFTNLNLVGTYTFRMLVTDNNGALAADTMNVVVSAAVPVAIDLVSDSLTIGAGPYVQNSPISLTGVVRNNGTQNVATPFIDIFQYQWNGTGGSWTDHNTPPGHPSLNAGVSATDISTPFTPGQSGTLYIRYCVDWTNAIVETAGFDGIAANCRVSAAINVTPQVFYSCLAPAPAYATLCAGDSSGLSGDTSSILVSGCSVASGPKCEYACDPGYTRVGTQCVGGSLTVSQALINGPTDIIVNWNTTNAAPLTCTVTGGVNPWNGYSGPQTALGVSNTTQFNLACGGVVIDSKTVTLNNAPVIPILSSSDRIVEVGDSVTLNWDTKTNDPALCQLTSNNGTVIYGLGSLPGIPSSIGNTIPLTINATTKFTLNCGGTATKSVTVEVVPKGTET